MRDKSGKKGLVEKPEDYLYTEQKAIISRRQMGCWKFSFFSKKLRIADDPGLTSKPYVLRVPGVH
jgi:Tfp pilus assembly pilus retraction ATPase PilT